MTVAVVGLARSGRAAALLLARLGHRVIAVDASAVDASELAAAGIEVRAPFDGPVDGIDLVVKSPGVPSAATPVATARAAGVPIISEVELASRHLPNPIIGVTGTNGKTTTTELTAHLLNTAGIAARACGNQGTPMCGLVGEVDPATWLVVECSSFQLEDIDRFHPRAAVLLNVTPDHLDRHSDMADYLSAKLRIFVNQDAADLAIIPRDVDLPSTEVIWRHVDEGAPGPQAVCWSQDGLHHATLGLIAAWEDVALRGRHNRQNAMAAVALAAHAGAGHEAKVSVVSLDQVPRALAARDTRGLIKLVADAHTDRLLGGQILAPEGADSIQTLAVALSQGMAAKALGEMIFPYLTTVEGLKLAAQGFDKDVAKLSCCAG